MQRWLVRAVVALVVLIGASTIRTPPVISHLGPRVALAQQDPKTITVYVTKTGEKYHRDGCQYLRQSRIPMVLTEAAKRFGPCSVCKPPTP